jgi:hypothetical protein
MAISGRRTEWTQLNSTPLYTNKKKKEEFNSLWRTLQNPDSSVGGVTGWKPRLDSRQGLETFLHSVHTGSGAHGASYPMGVWALYRE